MTIRVEELIGKRALTVADHPVGQVAQTPLYANKVLEQKDVAPASRVTGPNSNRGPLVKVKRGTTVRLVARKGALKVELAAAKLLDNAAVGDRVTVENPDSKKQIVGQLVAKDVVRIDF